MKKHYRHENDCLNCGTVLEGKFCHHCGQENLQIKENFGHLMNHAISDYFHFDHQFFHTLKPLLLQPGKLTSEYMAGRRVQYLHPIKMYIFISLIFFILFFKHNNSEEETDGKKHANKEAIAKIKKDMENDKSMNPLQKKIMEGVVENAQNVSVDTTNDTTKKGGFNLTVDKNALAGGNNVKITTTKSKDSTRSKHNWHSAKADNVVVTGAASKHKADKDNDDDDTSDGSFTSRMLKDSKDSTYAAYLNSQKSMPADARDNFFERMFEMKRFAYKKYGDRAKEVFLEDFKHNVPKMMFVLLPLFAVILRFAFWKNKKFYVEHLIFSFHLHCFLFLFLTIIMLLMMLPLTQSFRGWINFAATMGVIIYIYKSLKAVYHRSRWRTISKMIGMSFAYGFVFSFCMLILVMITAVTAV